MAPAPDADWRELPAGGLVSLGRSLVSGSRLQEPEKRWPPEFTVTVLPYVMLWVCFVLTAVLQSYEQTQMLINLGLCAVAGAWMLWMFTLHPAWRQRPRTMAVFYAGLIVIMAVLVIRASWLGLFTFTAYFYALKVIRWPWRLLGVAAVGIMAAISQTYGIDKVSGLGLLIFLVVVAVNLIGSCGFTYFVWNSGVQAELRRQAVEELSETNRKLETTLAENAGLHAQLLTQAREAGVLDERHRMAREIHDTLAQGLTGIITQLQAAEQAGQDLAAWRKHAQAATALARESLSEARRSVHALRPESLETKRLSDALAGVAERWATLHGVPVQVTTTGTERPIRHDAELALLRTAQEALTNVAKHARATRAGLTLSYMDNEVALDVRDDGRGFDLARLAGPAGGGGFGLVAMRQRVEGQGGTLQVESEPGGGTAISACIPAAFTAADKPAAPTGIRA
jgi:signal transduction histidine kinase